MTSQNASLRGRLVLRVRLGDERLAVAVAGALRPDDRDAPSGVSLEQRVEEGQVVYEVVFEGGARILYTVRNIADELLEHMAVVARSVQDIR